MHISIKYEIRMKLQTNMEPWKFAVLFFKKTSYKKWEKNKEFLEVPNNKTGTIIYSVTHIYCQFPCRYICGFNKNSTFALEIRPEY